MSFYLFQLTHLLHKISYFHCNTANELLSWIAKETTTSAKRIISLKQLAIFEEKGYSCIQFKCYYMLWKLFEELSEEDIWWIWKMSTKTEVLGWIFRNPLALFKWLPLVMNILLWKSKVTCKNIPGNTIKGTDPQIKSFKCKQDNLNLSKSMVKPTLNANSAVIDD